MPIPSRPVPRVGEAARVTHFGGGSERAVIVRVEEDGRGLQVRTESGELLDFTLSPATARFATAEAGGPRLELLEGR